MATTITQGATVADIAQAIRREWVTINPYASEYLTALESINTNGGGYYYADTVSSAINYFLANASGYRGANAKEYKAALKVMAAK
jgi:hypothetical protein